MAFRPQRPSKDEFKESDALQSSASDDDLLDMSETPSRTSGRPLDYQALCELAEDDPHKAMAIFRSQREQAASGVREQDYAGAAIALSYAQRLANDDEEWDWCSGQKFWEQQQVTREEVVLVAFKFTYNALRGNPYERARFHAKALRAAYRDRLDPSRVRQFIIDRGGFRALHDAECSFEAEQKTRLDQADEPIIVSSPDDTLPEAQTKAVGADEVVKDKKEVTEEKAASKVDEDEDEDIKAAKELAKKMTLMRKLAAECGVLVLCPSPGSMNQVYGSRHNSRLDLRTRRRDVSDEWFDLVIESVRVI